jgi:DNA-binding transcriptional MerR regulator
LNLFNIKDIENLTGIKAHTLRAWEKRYGIILPPTPPGKHRQYDNNDLRHILKVTSLYHSGFKISKIANMSEEEINTISATAYKKSNFEVFIIQLISFTMSMENEPFDKLCAELIETMGEQEFFIRVAFPFLNRIGMLWTTGDLVPVQEHFASNLIRNNLIAAIDRIPRAHPQEAHHYMLFCPVNEYHELPLLFMDFMLKKNKRSTVYLGVNTAESTVNEILDKMRRKNSNVTLLLYMMVNFTQTTAGEYLNTLANRFPNLRIICGGPALSGVVAQDNNLVIRNNLIGLLETCLEEGNPMQR